MRGAGSGEQGLREQGAGILKIKLDFAIFVIIFKAFQKKYYIW
jgi:hypothetical protein